MARKAPPKKRILVVDDDPAVMEVFGAILIEDGYEVIEAGYALPALFRAADSQPDLILVDLNMPMMNGIELIDQFKAHLDTKDIPVVVITGSDSEKVRKEAFEAGCAAYLTKPLEAGLLLAQIKKLLPNRKRAKS